MFTRLSQITQKVSPDLRKITNNIGWLLIDQVLQMGLGLLVGVWVARYLGPEQFGLLNYALSFVAMFSPFVRMGLNSIVVRDLANASHRKEETLGTAFGLSLLGGVIVIGLAVTLSTVLDSGSRLTPYLVGIIATATLFQSFDIIDFWFQSQVQSKYTVLARRAAYLSICATRVILIYLHAPLIAFAWARLVELGLSAMGMVIVYQLRGNRIRNWEFVPERAGELLKEGFPLILSGLSIYIYSKVDQVMLGALLDDKAQLGFYSAAVRIAEIFDFLPGIIAASVLPKLSQLKAQGSAYSKRLQVYFDIMLLMWLAVAIPVTVLAPYMIDFLYGSSYRPAGLILTVYIWGQFASNLGTARSSFLTVERKLHYSLYISISGAFLNIGLNFWLIPHYQAIGATIATLITYFFVAVISNLLIKDLRIIAAMIFRSLNLFRATSRILELFR